MNEFSRKPAHAVPNWQAHASTEKKRPSIKESRGGGPAFGLFFVPTWRFFFNCFYAGRVGWETELFPGGGGLTCAETRNTQAYSEYADKTAAFLAFLTPPCAGWWFFGNNFRPALFTCTKRRACFQTNNAKPPPAGFGGVVRRSCAITKKNMPFCAFFSRAPSTVRPLARDPRVLIG